MVVTNYGTNPVTTPSDYGWLMTASSCIPLALSVPFFLYSGLVMRRLNREKNKNMEEENKKASIFIRSNHGAEDSCYLGEMKSNLFNELKELKVSIKHQMSVGLSGENTKDLEKEPEHAT